MPVISRDTFDPLDSYIRVRLQQGVPLVDADWNEAHDVRKFEVQAFLKWFVGNGVPEGNDGFRIGSLNPAVVRDFVIQRGVSAAPDRTNNIERGLRHVGRCLVDGMDVLIPEDCPFRAQPLHVSQGEDAIALSTTWNVPTIAEVPNVNDTVVVYLDVWERLVTAQEDPSLVHSDLGVESCARMKREWVVRARAGRSVPTPDDPNDPNDPNRFIAGHSYYALATIAHKAGVPITNEAITDQRERRLLMPPATLFEDLLGPVDYLDYRRGQGRPLVNLREAINTLLRGELPGSPETHIGSEAGSISFGRGTFCDAAHGLITTWGSGELVPSQIFAARLDLARPEAGFRTIKEITGPGNNHHHATLLDNGDVLLVYETGAAAPNIVMQQGPFDTLLNAPVITVTDTAAGERFPFAVAAGGKVLILWHEDAGNTLQCKWYDPHNATHPFSEAHTLAEQVPQGGDLHAAVGPHNTVWVAFSDASDPFAESKIQAIAVPSDEQPDQPQSQLLQSPHGHPKHPFVMVDHSENVWVFWQAFPGQGGIWYRRFLSATGAWEIAESTHVPGTDAGELAQASPTAVSDAEGGIWLFWLSTAHIVGLSTASIWYARYNPVTQIWGEPRQMTGFLRHDADPFVLRGPDGSLWLFWRRSVGNPGVERYQLFYRRIFPSI
jgi:hypothetical protein